MARTKRANNENSAANLGFEAKLWLAADKLRSNMDASEYKHVVLGLIFLKYISDAFEETARQAGRRQGGLRRRRPGGRRRVQEPRMSSGSPSEARWGYIQDHARSGDKDASGKPRDIGRLDRRRDGGHRA